jgi:hypothetical protein
MGGNQSSTANQTVNNTVKAIVNNTNETIDKAQVTNFQSQLISISDVDYLKFKNSTIRQDMKASVNMDSLFQIQSSIDSQQSLKNDIELTAKAGNSGLALFSKQDSEVNQTLNNFVTNTMNSLNEVRNSCVSGSTQEQDIILNGVSYVDIESGELIQQAASNIYEKCVINSNSVTKTSQITDNTIKADAEAKNSGLSLGSLIWAAALLLAILLIGGISTVLLFERMILVFVGLGIMMGSIPYWIAYYARRYAKTTMNMYPYSTLLGKTRTDCGLSVQEVRTDIDDYGTAVAKCLQDKKCQAVDFQAYNITPKPGCVVTPICLASDKTTTKPCSEGETPVKVTTFYNGLVNAKCAPANDCKPVMKNGTRVYYAGSVSGVPAASDGDFSYDSWAEFKEPIGSDMVGGYGSMTLTKEADGDYTLSSSTYDFTKSNGRFFFAPNLSFSRVSFSGGPAFSGDKLFYFDTLADPLPSSVKLRFNSKYSSSPVGPPTTTLSSVDDVVVVRAWPVMQGIPDDGAETFSVFIELSGTGRVWLFKDGIWVPQDLPLYGGAAVADISQVQVGGGGGEAGGKPWDDYSSQMNPYVPAATPLSKDPSQPPPPQTSEPVIPDGYKYYIQTQGLMSQLVTYVVSDDRKKWVRIASIPLAGPSAHPVCFGTSESNANAQGVKCINTSAVKQVIPADKLSLAMAILFTSIGGVVLLIGGILIMGGRKKKNKK